MIHRSLTRTSTPTVLAPRHLLRQSRHLSSSSSPFHLTRSSTVAPSSTTPMLLSRRIPAPTRARILSRWYSDASPTKEDQPPNEPTPPDSNTAKEAPKEPDPTAKELEAKNKEIHELKDRYLRSVADYRNLQDRTARDMAQARTYAIQKFAQDLVESVDNLDLALSNVDASKTVAPSGGAEAPAPPAPEDPYKELRELHSGLSMTFNILLNTMKKHGLERFDPSETGEKFDPNLHEATFQTPQAGKEDGSCFYTTQKGFSLNGRVLRAAKVGVVKNS